MGDYLKDVRGEWKKVTWPAREDVIKTSIAVGVSSIFFGVFLFVVDVVFSRAIQGIMDLLK